MSVGAGAYGAYGAEPSDKSIARTPAELDDLLWPDRGEYTSVDSELVNATHMLRLLRDHCPASYQQIKTFRYPDIDHGPIDGPRFPLILRKPYDEEFTYLLSKFTHQQLQRMIHVVVAEDAVGRGFEYYHWEFPFLPTGFGKMIESIEVEKRTQLEIVTLLHNDHHFDKPVAVLTATYLYGNSIQSSDLGTIPSRYSKNTILQEMDRIRRAFEADDISQAELHAELQKLTQSTVSSSAVSPSKKRRIECTL